jgi:hypothetical protein
MNTNQHFIGILVVYSRSYAAKAINEFFSILQALSGSHSMIVVFNDDLQLLVDPRYEAIRGSNANAEFSGWDEGLAFACDEMGRFLNKDSVFIFANDTFCHHRAWDANLRCQYKRRLSSWAQSSSCTAFGFVDHSQRPFVIDNMSITSWISTFYFALRYDAICSLGGRLSPRADVLLALLPASGVAHDEFFGVGMDPVLRSHLCSWLFGSGKRSWYKAEPLTANSFNKMRIKASAILSEKILSARLRRSGIGFYAVNRLQSFKARFVCLCFAVVDSIKVFFGRIWVANASWDNAGVGK